MSNGFQLVAHDYNNSNVQQNLRLCNCSHKIFICCGNTTALLRRVYGVRGRRYVSAGFGTSRRVLGTSRRVFVSV